MKSFQARLIVFVLILLALAQLGTALAVLSSLKKDNYRQGVDSIDVSRNVFDLFLEARAEQLTKGVEILTSDFGFKQAVATRETATIGSVLQNHGARINADVSLLVSPVGELITSTQELNVGSTIADLVYEARRTGGASISTMINLGSRAYQLVLVPVRAPNVVAWVGMAFLLDQALAEQIKNVTGLDISFVSENDDTYRLAGWSTLPLTDKQALFRDLDSVTDLLNAPVFSSDEKYLTLGVDLGVPDQWGLIHLPYGPWLESYNSTRNQLVLIFAGALALALLFGIGLARNMTQPISRLVEYATQIGRGTNKKIIAAPKMAGEFGVLSNTMEVMQESIKAREEELTYQAWHDPLTGLVNQSAVERYLIKTLPRQQGSLVLINIRHFKQINNMLGFDVGNILLTKMAERLQRWNGATEILARLSGDKFLLITEHNISSKDCDDLKRLFNEECEVSCDHHDRMMTEECESEKGSMVRLDISIAILPFEHATDSVNSAMRRLDIVADKARAENESVVIYEAGQDEDHRRKLSIIRDLPEALVANQLFVVYQPKVSGKTQDCHEAEALIRWIHPTLGFLPPDEFIELLERSGSIQILTQWVIHSVLAQLKIWWAEGHEIRVAINLSAHDLLDETLPDMVAQALKTHGLPERALALEVTESAVMKDRVKVIRVLKALRDMGIHLAIDDFGTGQSSLSYLRELPVNEVKIDRAFIQFIDTNKDDEFITKATIDLSHSLGLQVTAEGAENAQGVALLNTYQCDKIQGYFFSKPLVANEFFQWREAFHKG